MPNTTITIDDDDDIHPVKPEPPEQPSLGGVYHTRSISRHRKPGDGRRSASQDGRGEETSDIEDGNDDWLREDGKKKQVFKGTALLWLAYQSVGAIYGDIGTSPLYVYSSTFTDEPSYDSLLEVLSVIIWSLTIMVTFKYVLIVLRADNQGEGGTFSCYSLLTRYANLTDRDPREAAVVKMERHETQDLSPSNQSVRRRMEDSKFLRGLLKTIGVLSVSMVIADGILTPAQSVLGAIQGLAVVSPNITSSTIVGTSSGILILLFAIQPLGLTKLASAFAPIVIVWLALNASFGIYNLVNYDHSVLKAFSPYYAIHFFVRGKTESWKKLGGILLSFTGVEALFADRQAAFISVHPEAYSNPFFNSVPPGLLYPSLVIAVLAAIVASQAMITACFQVPDGAWFTLTLAAILAGIFLLWRFGKENQWRAEAEDRFRPNQLISKGADDKLSLTMRWGGGLIAPIRGFGIYFDKTGVLTPTVFTQFVTKFGAIPEVVVFFHLHPVEIPTLPSSERYMITRLGAIPGCYRLVVRHGFMDEVITPDLAALIYEQIRKFVVRQAGSNEKIEDASSDAADGSSTALSENPPPEDSGKGKQRRAAPVELEDAKVRQELARLDRAFATKVSYVVGKEQMKIKMGASLFRRLVLETFLFIRDNTRAKIANLRLAMDRVVEVGFVKEI
ncbi:hypothetical protein GQX73_g4748 [Xylaria multiplex]|uniref:Potassium transporter n=1 Tax=Xylaria multiplex TaxID=323545 RepID=A0A7C8N806_9PEZI|nr:hypothetical protein GQX73_g4748 [Xylaria multiplex]